MNFSAFKKCKNSFKSTIGASKCLKMANFALLKSTKLISRKILSDRKVLKFPQRVGSRHMYSVEILGFYLSLFRFCVKSK